MTTKRYPRRTNQQNKALHVLFGLLANELNDRGLDMRKTLKPGVEIPWQAAGVKEHLWKPVMKAQLHKYSTTEMTTKEIDQVFDTINRHLGTQFGISLNFPSVQDLMIKELK